MKHCIFITIILLFTCITQAQTQWASDWKTHPIPTIDDTIVAYTNSKHDWEVFLQDDKVGIRPLPKENEKKLPFVLPPNRLGAQKFLGSKSFIAVEDGFLVGFNNGENASKLFWFSKNGQENEIISKQYAVVQFLQSGNVMYAIDATGTGSIITIQKKAGKWEAQPFVKLPSLPEAACVDEQQNFIIITTDNLVQVQPNGSSKTLVKDMLWSGTLYPNSLVALKGQVYIGMKQGVYRLTIATGKQEWLMEY
jgi:hypothetical protein